MADLDEGSIRAINGAQAVGTSRFNWQSFASFEKDAAKPIQWIVEGLIPAIGLTLLVGEPFVGKSRFMNCLFAARSRPADGNTIAGLKVRPGRSALLSLEHSATGVACSIAAARRGRGLKEVNALILRNKPLINILDPLDRALLIEELNDKNVDLVAFDSIRRIPGFKENNSEEVSLVMSAFNEICDERRAVVAYHHTPRGSTGRPRGSADFEASSEAVIAVTGKKGQPLTLSVTNHDADNARYYMLPVHVGAAGDPRATLRMEVSDGPEESDGDTGSWADEDLEGTVLAFLRLHPEGSSIRVLKHELCKGFEALSPVLHKLKKAGMIVHRGGKQPWAAST